MVGGDIVCNVVVVAVAVIVIVVDDVVNVVAVMELVNVLIHLNMHIKISKKAFTHDKQQHTNPLNMKDVAIAHEAETMKLK